MSNIYRDVTPKIDRDKYRFVSPRISSRLPKTVTNKSALEGSAALRSSYDALQNGETEIKMPSINLAIKPNRDLPQVPKVNLSELINTVQQKRKSVILKHP